MSNFKSKQYISFGIILVLLVLIGVSYNYAYRNDWVYTNDYTFSSNFLEILMIVRVGTLILPCIVGALFAKILFNNYSIPQLFKVRKAAHLLANFILFILILYLLIMGIIIISDYLKFTIPLWMNHYFIFGRNYSILYGLTYFTLGYLYLNLKTNQIE